MLRIVAGEDKKTIEFLFYNSKPPYTEMQKLKLEMDARDPNAIGMIPTDIRAAKDKDPNTLLALLVGLGEVDPRRGSPGRFLKLQRASGKDWKLADKHDIPSDPGACAGIVC